MIEEMTRAKEITSQLHRNFICNLKARRKALNLNQVDVAAALGITQGSYSELERGEYTPTIEVIERVATALRIAPEKLLRNQP